MASFSSIPQFRDLDPTSLTFRLHQALLKNPKKEVVEQIMGKDVIERERMIGVITIVPEKIVRLISSYFNANEKIRRAVNEKIVVDPALVGTPVNALGLLIDRVTLQREYGGYPGTWGAEARATLKLLMQRGAQCQPSNYSTVVYFWSQPGAIESNHRYNINLLPLTRVEKLMVKDIRESTRQPALPGDEDEDLFYDSTLAEGCQIS